MSFNSTVVVIPAYQAQATIGLLVKAILGFRLPVIVVDDASRDATARVAQEAGAKVVQLPRNAGKGRALRTGWELACQEGFHWIATLDADGQHLPAELPQFLKAASGGQADLIVGNRMNHPRGMPLERWITNGLMSWVLSRVTNLAIPDSQCGFRLISRRILEQVRLTTDRFEIESELLVKSAWAGFRILSIPVTCVYRRQISFIRPVQDTVRFFRFLRATLKERPEGNPAPPPAAPSNGAMHDEARS